jgi:hypothetical protein
MQEITDINLIDRRIEILSASIHEQENILDVRIGCLESTREQLKRAVAQKENILVTDAIAYPTVSASSMPKRSGFNFSGRIRCARGKW